MRSVKLTQQMKNEVSVPFTSIYYPNDSQAEFAGNVFARRPYAESVHYQTCEQLGKGEPIEKLAYFHWTIEKLTRFGTEYEKFLFSESKGCSIEGISLDETIGISNSVKRRALLARHATIAFTTLFDSIMDHWDPNLCKNDVIFQKLPRGKFTVEEGRHRIAILMYKYRESDSSAFQTDAEFVRKGYYIRTFKHNLRRWIKSILSLK